MTLLYTRTSCINNHAEETSNQERSAREAGEHVSPLSLIPRARPHVSRCLASAAHLQFIRLALITSTANIFKALENQYSGVGIRPRHTPPAAIQQRLNGAAIFQYGNGYGLSNLSSRPPSAGSVNGIEHLGRCYRESFVRLKNILNAHPGAYTKQSWIDEIMR